MKKIILALLLLFSLCGCSSYMEAVQTPEPTATVQAVSTTGETKYFVTFKVKQSHFTLDIGQHLKDEMNAAQFEIMVDADYYNAVDVGDKVCDDFRVGSFVLYGSVGSWDITVADKRTA